jgi:MFS family permease
VTHFPYGRAFLFSLGFFGINAIWPVFNNYVPIFLHELGLSAILVGFIMTWDNYLNMFIQPVVGDLSDKTYSRIGRRKPWLLVGAPLAAIFFVLIPLMGTPASIMVVILLTNIAMALFRSPAVALLGDLFPPEQRSTAGGVLDLMGGLGAIVALVGGGVLYSFGRITPFAFGSLVMLTAILVVVLRVREPKVAPPVETKYGGLDVLADLRQVLASQNRSGIIVLLALLCTFLGIEAIQTWISSFGKYNLNIEPDRMSLIMLAFALPFLIFAIPAGWTATRLGRRRTILIGLVAMTVLLAFGWFIQNEVTLIGTLILAGVSWALVSVNSLPLVYDVGGETRIGASTGLYYLSVNIAAAVGPQVVGVLIDLTAENYRVVFLFSALTMALAGLLLVWVRGVESTSGQVQAN